MMGDDLKIAIGHIGERVHIYFTESVGQIDFSVKQAKEIAALLIKHAEAIEGELNEPLLLRTH